MLTRFVLLHATWEIVGECTPTNVSSRHQEMKEQRSRVWHLHRRWHGTTKDTGRLSVTESASRILGTHHPSRASFIATVYEYSLHLRNVAANVAQQPLGYNAMSLHSSQVIRSSALLGRLEDIF